MRTPKQRKQPPRNWRRRAAAFERLLAQPAYKYLRHYAKDLIQIFLSRKALRLCLTDHYLMKLWDRSARTIQRWLIKLIDLGLLERNTGKPVHLGEGKFRQDRTLRLRMPKNKDLSTPIVKPKPKNEDFADYLATRNRVSKEAFAYNLRKMGARADSMGHLLKNIWPKIANRADVLESILLDGKNEKLTGEKLVAFVVKEIHARIDISGRSNIVRHIDSQSNLLEEKFASQTSSNKITEPVGEKRISKNQKVEIARRQNLTEEAQKRDEFHEKLRAEAKKTAEAEKIRVLADGRWELADGRIFNPVSGTFQWNSREDDTSQKEEVDYVRLLAELKAELSAL